MKPMHLFTAVAALLCAGAVHAADAAASRPAAMPASSAARAAIAAACKADMERLCAGVQPGEGRIVACMREHRQEMSEGCKKELGSGRRGKGG